MAKPNKNMSLAIALLGCLIGFISIAFKIIPLAFVGLIIMFAGIYFQLEVLGGN